MTPLDAAAQAATVAARAAAGLCDSADMRRTMQQAREALHRMNGKRLTRFEVGDLVIVSGEYEAIIESFNDDDTVTVRSEATGRRYNVAKDQIEPVDFSAAILRRCQASQTRATTSMPTCASCAPAGRTESLSSTAPKPKATGRRCNNHAALLDRPQKGEVKWTHRKR